jgi:hypothetical protein
MTTLQVPVSESLLAKLQDLAARKNVAVDQFAAVALEERVLAESQMKYLEERAARGSREKFLRVMSKVPSIPPIPPDELPPEEWAKGS